MSSMPDAANTAYIYRTRDGAVSVPAGDVELHAIWALDARRRRRRLSLKTFRGGHAVTKEIRSGSTGLLLRHSRSKKPPRREILFAHANIGTIVQRTTSELLHAVVSLIDQIQATGDDLAVEFGIVMNIRDPVLSCVSPDRYTVVLSTREIEAAKQCCWSNFYTGIRFPNDPHSYSFWSGYGVLDRIKHEPHTLLEIERSDIRSCEVKLCPINAGRMRFFHQAHDLNALRIALAKLRDFLEGISDATVEMMAVPIGRSREQYESLGAPTYEQRGFWPLPSD